MSIEARVLVTGAAGFIGSNVVARMIERGRRVAAVDAFRDLEGSDASSETWARSRALRGLSVDACVDRDDLAAYLDSLDAPPAAIVHMGACSDTTVSDRDYVMRVNLAYTQMLFRYAAAHRVPFVYASSAATYGDGYDGYDDEAEPSTLRPLNLYGESKQAFDLWALEQSVAPPRWFGLKFFNVYGPRESHKGRMASVALHAFRQVRANGRVKLFKSHIPGTEDGGQQRDFVSVEDAVDVIEFLLDRTRSTSAESGLYNVGTGQARTFADLAKAVFAAMGRPVAIDYIDMPVDLRGRYQTYTQASMNKLQRAGYAEPFRSLEQGVSSYVRWLEANE